MPVPRVLATYEDRGIKYLVTEYVTGVTPKQAWTSLKPDQLAKILKQLRRYINQIRSIPPPKPSVVAGSADHSPCMDQGLFPDSLGPFARLDDFHLFIHRVDNENHPHPRVRELVRAHKSEKYRNFRVVFTHCDPAPRNIIIHDGNATGIVDWELAGWYPEY